MTNELTKKELMELELLVSERIYYLPGNKKIELWKGIWDKLQELTKR